MLFTKLTKISVLFYFDICKLQVSVIFQAVIRAYKENEDYITVDIQFCSSREFYKFVNFVVDLLNGTLQLRLFHEDTLHELLDYAIKFDSPSLKVSKIKLPSQILL